MIADPTTPETAQNATQIDAIDLSQTQLLGLFAGSGEPRALLRGADGTVTMVQANTRTPLGDVTTISDSYVLLRNGSTIRRLTVPR